MRGNVLTPIVLAAGLIVAAQRPGEAQEKRTIAAVLDHQFATAEQDLVSAAEAMPEAKYAFVPTNGEFKGVRTFGQQLKHVAVYNYRSFGAMLGEKPAPDGDNGPDSVRTKEQILKYLKDSFALGHRAIAKVGPDNLLSEVKNSPEEGYDTPLALVTFACWHAYDHYGQIVEYLRMNHIVPPASRNSPAANPR
jgi:uncharacterized damage-inducible protein DinB